MLKGLEETLSEVQRVDAKAQSAVDMKKQNLTEETKKRKELVKSMEEVRGGRMKREGVRGGCSGGVCVRERKTSRQPEI